MSLERGGVEYLNTDESAKLFGTTYITFKVRIDELGVPGRKFPGQGPRIFYKKSIVERLRDTSEEDIPTLKKALIEEGEAKETLED